MFCFHNNVTSPRRDEKGTYIRCLDCTKRISWKWKDTRKLRKPRVTAPIIKGMRELERMIK